MHYASRSILAAQYGIALNTSISASIFETSVVVLATPILILTLTQKEILSLVSLQKVMLVIVIGFS
jgi:hypothetical protein